MKERVIVYIDGFNLYFGMTSKFKGIKWLNVRSLAESLLKPHQALCSVKYFTSRVSNDPPKEHRQSKYLDAIKRTETQIIYGHYKSKPKSCFSCGHTWQNNEEKMTDVNIAVHMLVDALDDEYDM
nr:NYN domain-containing protein [Saprospiraceae bacterium]